MNDQGWWLLTNYLISDPDSDSGWSLCSISISGKVIIKILRLFSYSGHSLKFKNLEIGLYPTQELYLRWHIHNLFSFNYYVLNIIMFWKQTCYSHNNNGVLYLHLCSKTTSAELSLRFVVFTNSTQIFREHVISGLSLSLSLSLSFVSNHQPRLSFYRLIKVMPKLIKFKGQRSQDNIPHI